MQDLVHDPAKDHAQIQVFLCRPLGSPALSATSHRLRIGAALAFTHSPFSQEGIYVHTRSRAMRYCFLPSKIMLGTLPRLRFGHWLSRKTELKIGICH